MEQEKTLTPTLSRSTGRGGNGRRDACPTEESTPGEGVRGSPAQGKRPPAKIEPQARRPCIRGRGVAHLVGQGYIPRRCR